MSKIGDLVYCAGFGEQDFNGNRGHVGVIVKPTKRIDRDWLVEIPGKPSGVPGGLWAARDSWLVPIRGGPEPEAEHTVAPKETESA